jgi:hypothetical protein
MRDSARVGTRRRLQNSPRWLVGMGVISLALEPVSVEEQPVPSTTITLRVTIRNAYRAIAFTKGAGTTVSKQTTTA